MSHSWTYIGYQWPPDSKNLVFKSTLCWRQDKIPKRTSFQLQMGAFVNAKQLIHNYKTAQLKVENLAPITFALSPAGFHAQQLKHGQTLVNKAKHVESIQLQKRLHQRDEITLLSNNKTAQLKVTNLVQTTIKFFAIK